MSKIINDLKLQFRLGSPELRLIYVNIAVFLVSIIFFFQFKIGVFNYPDWLGLNANFGKSLVFPWTYISYGFLHSDFFHLLFNMIILNISGRLFHTFFNPKQFWGVYFMGMIFSGLIFQLGFLLLDRQGLLVGASAAIMSILIASATYSPNMMLRLMLIGNVKLWVVAAVILGLDLMYLFAENTGGHISHLAGAVFGFIFTTLLKQGTDLTKPFSMMMDFVHNGFKFEKKHNFKKVHKNPKQTNTKNNPPKDRTQQQIDEILDKISKSGYDSLTKEEKDFLFQAGK